MPRNYVRKTFRGTIDPKVMIQCARKVLEDGKSISSVAREYGINSRTLSRFCTRVDINKLLNADEKVGYICGYKKICQVLTDEEETMLIDYLEKASDMLCSLSSKRVREFAYEFAIKKGKKVPPSWNTNKQAGPDWLKNFMKRHSNFSITSRSHSVKSAKEETSRDRNTPSLGIGLENLEMDLSFQMVDSSFNLHLEDNYLFDDCDPLQKSLAEAQSLEIDEKVKMQSDQSSSNNQTNNCNECLSVKSEVDDLPESLVASFEISTVISERDVSQRYSSAIKNLPSVVLPSSWSISELPVGEVHRFCLSFIVTVTKNNIVTPVLEKCILIDAKREMVFKARNKTMDREKLKLPRILSDLGKLPVILKKFQSIPTCTGLGKVEPCFLKDYSAIEDCLNSWRHRECPVLLIKNERCQLCSKSLKTKEENLLKVS